MSKQIDPGEGYRLLTMEDIRTKGDECYSRSEKEWVPIRRAFGCTYAEYIALGDTYRRKLPVPPHPPIPEGWQLARSKKATQEMMCYIRSYSTWTPVTGLSGYDIDADGTCHEGLYYVIEPIPATIEPLTNESAIARVNALRREGRLQYKLDDHPGWWDEDAAYEYRLKPAEHVMRTTMPISPDKAAEVLEKCGVELEVAE